MIRHDTQMAHSSDPPPRIPSTLWSDVLDVPTGLVRHDAWVELPPGSVVDETYEIDAKIGAGAMGEVYAARHLELGKRVAIKVIGARLSKDAGAIARFAQEARTLAQIQHPAIVAVEHVGKLADGRAYFVMELLRGESLFDRLSRGRLPLLEALRILDQMARGLEAAHAHGVIHRDLKPENVFLVHLPNEPPIVKLVDYGLAKLDDAARTSRVQRTQSGAIVGTPAYMSPEQMRGTDVDHRTDVYALGCVGYELLLGQAPFPQARTVPELFAAHLHESPPLPRSIWANVPPQLDLVLFAMLAKEPAHRPTIAQVRTVIADVASARADQPGRAATLFVGPPSKRVWRLVGALLVLLGTVFAGAAIGTVLTSRSSDSTEASAVVPHGSVSPTLTPIPPDAPISPDAPLEPISPDAPLEPLSNAEAPKLDAAPQLPIPQPQPQPPQPKDPPPTTSRHDDSSSAIELPEPPPPKLKPSRPSTAIDRNQTIDPFAQKPKPTSKPRRSPLRRSAPK